MLPITGRWIFLCQKIEFHVKDGVCQCVYHRGSFLPHPIIGWRAIGVMGPPRRYQKDPINIGDSLIFAKNGEVFYTPPIEEIRRAKKSTPKFLPERPAPKEKRLPVKETPIEKEAPLM
jgi:hypothetical protein